MRVLRPYLLIVLGVWALGTVAAYLYAQQLGLAWGSVVGLLPADVVRWKLLGMPVLPASDV